MAEEWKPRGRDLVIDGLHWVARMADKARAKLGGYIGEYIYPCPMDQKVLTELGLTPEAFMEIAISTADDAELAAKVKAASGKQAAALPR